MSSIRVYAYKQLYSQPGGTMKGAAGISITSLCMHAVIAGGAHKEREGACRLLITVHQGGTPQALLRAIGRLIQAPTFGMLATLVDRSHTLLMAAGGDTYARPMRPSGSDTHRIR